MTPNQPSFPIGQNPQTCSSEKKKKKKKVSTPPSPKQPAKSRALPAAPSDSPARDPCQCDDPQRRASVHLAVSTAGPTDASACDGTGVRGARYWAGGRESCISGRDLCFLALRGLRGRGAHPGQWRVVDGEGARMRGGGPQLVLDSCLDKGEQSIVCLAGAGCDGILEVSSASTRAASAVAGEIAPGDRSSARVSMFASPCSVS